MLKLLNCIALGASLFLIAGCTPPDPDPRTGVSIVAPPSTQQSPVIAEVAEIKINRSEVDELLYKTYGLRILFDVTEFEMARGMLKQAGGTLTTDDTNRERQLTMQEFFSDAQPSDWENLLNQLLQKEHITPEEFELKVIQTNACLRKIIEPQVVNKIPEDKLRLAYQERYGAKRKIADITVNNQIDAQRVKELLKSSPFALVARQYSQDPNYRDNGGEWPPFSIMASNVPKDIRAMAFSMEVNQVSDALQIGDKIHIIQLLGIIEPKVVKYQDVKDDVRVDLEQRLIKQYMTDSRKNLAAQAQLRIRIDDPILAEQWSDILKKARGNSGTVPPDDVKRKLNEEQQGTTKPTTLQTVK